LLDVNTFIGGYPFRHVPHPDAPVLERVLAREGIAGAWVGHLPSAFHRDPSHGNEVLFGALAASDRLSPVPTLRPDWPGWERALRDVVARGAVAVRAYPQFCGLAPGDPRLAMLAGALAEAGVPLVLTVRFEDLRQRHPIDTASDLTPAHVRELARSGAGGRIVITAAGRDFIEEVHWGLTPVERERVFWDISWLWGPPVDDLSHLIRTVGAGRFVNGSMWPLRLIQVSRANLALLAPDIRGTALADPSRWG
jgi:hypothetical protein